MLIGGECELLLLLLLLRYPCCWQLLQLVANRRFG